MQFFKLKTLKCIQHIRNCRYLSTRTNGSIEARFGLIGSGACGDPASFYLQAHNARYIFNCGEGVTRLVTANRIRLTSVEHMFFTQAKWRHVGGLGSLLMSFLENRKSLIVLHGAEPLSAIVRRIMASLNLLQHCGMCKFNETTDRFEDAHLRVDFIRLPSKDAATSMAYYGKLKCVHRVQLNGFRVRMTPEDAEDEDVINQSYDEPRDFDFLVLDIPSDNVHSHLDTVHNCVKNMSESGRLDLMIHFSAPNVIETSEYQKFMEKTHAARHLKLNESNGFTNLRNSNEIQTELNGIDPAIFPLLRSSNASVVPSNQYDERSNVYPKIVFLGTVSRSPSLGRNVTSILVHTSANNCILLDCGEGTCGQIIRFYGPKSMEIIRKISTVFVSHMHADHFHGLLRLIELRKELMHSTRNPLKLLVPKMEMKSWLFFYDNFVDAIHDDLTFIDNQNLTKGDGLSPRAAKQMNVKALKTCLVPHTETSYAVAITMESSTNRNEPFKLTFTGDTGPTDELIDLGKDSTLLIHEATFVDDVPRNMHCTVTQAIEHGRRMNAEFNVLTHFSRRNFIPWHGYDLDANVGIAFDNMELIESDLSRLNSIYSKIKLHFSNLRSINVN